MKNRKLRASWATRNEPKKYEQKEAKETKALIQSVIRLDRLIKYR